jgi:hypothetical protein
MAGAAPVCIAPRGKERCGRFDLGGGVMPMTATGAATHNAGERHPTAGPPAMPRNTFCTILTTCRRVLAPRAKAIKDLAGTMFVNPQKRVCDAAAQGHVSLQRRVRSAPR